MKPWILISLRGKKNFFWFLASDQLNIRAPCNYVIDVTMEALNLLNILMTVFFSSISTCFKSLNIPFMILKHFKFEKVMQKEERKLTFIEY